MTALFIVLAFQLTQAVAVGELGAPYTFRARHDHFWGGGEGTLSIGPQGLTFQEEDDEDHSRSWSFSQIQRLTVRSPRRLEILTYEDVKWQLNRDRTYHLELLDSEITPEVVAFLRVRLPAPPVSAVLSPAPAQPWHTVPAKHLHSLGGGCLGRLLFTEEALVFESQQREHSRSWPLETLLDLGRMSAFHLRVEAQEGSSLSRGRTYQFQLQEPLPETVYDRLWRRLYEPSSWIGSGSSH